MDKKYDVIISGAGPSGSLLGFLLSMNNIRTLILEKKIFPRYKICGGGIQHRTKNLLPYDISEVIENTIYGIYFSRKNENIVLKKYDRPIMYTVDRGNFDLFLSRKAENGGCAIFFGEEVENFEVSNSNVDVFTNKNKYSARILVGADGVRGFVHRVIVRDNKIKKILGYETEIPLSSKKNGNHKFSFTDKKGNKFVLKDNIRLDFKGVKKGYCWVFPKNNYLSCGMGALEENVKNMKKYFNFFASNFYRGDEEIKSQKLFAQSIPIRNKNTPLCDYRILNIGDAACLGDGFTGEGLYNSFKSAIFASESIIYALRNSIFNFKDYQNKIVEDIYRDIKTSLFFTKIFSGYFIFFYALLKKNDNLFNSCCKILRGEKTYSDIAKKLKLIKIR